MNTLKTLEMAALFGAISLAYAVDTAATSHGWSDSELQANIRAKDQAMMDAFATGERAVFDAAFAPEAVYLDENGNLMDRSAFLAQLQPLPAHTSGHIDLANYRFHRFGDVAIVTYMEVETENYHGQILHTNSLTSETWRETPSGWKIAITQTMVIPKDPPEVTLSSNDLAAYSGTYEGGMDLVNKITIQDGKLFSERRGRPGAPLRAELKDVFFIAGQPRTRKIFQRDATGSIVGYVDRREGEDVVWRRVAAP